MTRQLRPRTSQPNYRLVAAGLQEEPVAGPSHVDDDSDGSVFELEDGAAAGKGKDTAPTSEEEDDDDDEPPPKAKGKGKAKAKATPAKTPRAAKSAPKRDATQHTPATIKGGGRQYKNGNTLARASTRQMYVLPTPSVAHRHRAIPLIDPSGWGERMMSAPKPYGFGNVPTTLTDAFHRDRALRTRSARMWGYNVGAGPLWELTEDRAWFKEGKMDAKEGERRPLVYGDISLPSEWAIPVKEQEASTYLPSADAVEEEGTLKRPPPLPCSFGKIHDQTRLEMDMFQTVDLSDYISGKRSHVFNAGAPVWGLDWCPMFPSEREARGYKQYLAVGPFPSPAHSPEIGRKCARPFNACIQIWTLSCTDEETSEAALECDMVLCHESGPAYELKWCPLPSHDTLSEEKDGMRQLGLLAGTFEDGSMSIYAVPDPEQYDRDDSEGPVFVKVQPLVRVEMEGSACWSLDWANSELLCVSTTHGAVAVYNVKEAIKTAFDTNRTVESPLPTHYIQIHQSAIRAAVWLRAPSSHDDPNSSDPTVVVTGGYDGMVCLTDIRDGHRAVMNRTRDVINGLSFSPYTGGPLTTDHENIVKMYAASPSMLGRGHTLLEPDGPVWSISSSEYHPHVAVGSVDGACNITNTLRSTRKGKTLPVFVHKVFQLDYSRQTNEFRMLDNFLPQETQDRPAATRAARLDKSKSVRDVGNGAWPVQVGVTRDRKSVV